MRNWTRNGAVPLDALRIRCDSCSSSSSRVTRKSWAAPVHRRPSSTPTPVLEAQCLLGSTTRAVKEVAAELGYEDEAYFSRLFKKSVGVSPRDYQFGAV
jgi:AraC-like DNA-binding protein